MILPVLVQNKRQEHTSKRVNKPMTTIQPQPGPDLDAAIARAMGWKIRLEHAPELDDDCAYESWQSPDGSFHRSLPPISTDTATAMATLQQLCKPVEEGGRGHRYFIGSPRPTVPDDLYYVNISGKQAEAKTFAHTAALAMLAVLEAEKT